MTGAFVGAFAIAVTAFACSRGREPRAPGPVASALISVAADLGTPPTEIANAWTELERIAARIEARRTSRGEPGIDDFNAVVFDELKFIREIDDHDPRYFLWPSVIRERRGSCLGLGSLYLLLGERLGVPMEGVRLPGHFFVRTKVALPRNVELLRRGEAMPDTWYERKYGPRPEGNGEFFRPLTVTELPSLFWFNAGNHARAAGDLKGARHAFENAVADAPDFAEAQASLGAIRHLEGELPEAAAAYREAERLRSDLPGLERNMALLNEEQRKSESTRSSSP